MTRSSEPPEKKSERLEIRVGHSEKQGFMKACDSQGDTPSDAMRRFIRGYVRRADADVSGQAVRRLARRYGAPTLAATALLLAGGAGLAVSLLPERALDQAALFEALDTDGDGQLVPAELVRQTGSPDGVSALMRVLDLDASGALSDAEFRTAGRMAFAQETQPDDMTGRESETLPLTVVSFRTGPGGAVVDVFANAVVNAADFDRLVVWYADRTATVMEGAVDIEMRDGEFVMRGASAVTLPPPVATPADGSR
ncbi:MAG: hypothetical protein WBG08_05920 [Litorimonas sp.]